MINSSYFLSFCMSCWNKRSWRTKALSLKFSKCLIPHTYIFPFALLQTVFLSGIVNVCTCMYNIFYTKHFKYMHVYRIFQDCSSWMEVALQRACNPTWRNRLMWWHPFVFSTELKKLIFWKLSQYILQTCKH